MATTIGELLVKLSADIKGLDKELKKARGELKGFESYAKSWSASLKKALTFAAAGLGVYEAVNLLKRGLGEAMKASDSFALSTISAAATITDMAERNGQDLKSIYDQAFSYAKGMYFDLQEAAAKYFASGADMVQAWNVLIQKGVVLQKSEIDNLGILVDKIKLATQGQVGYYQIAQEIRAFMDGHANAASQLALLLKSQVGPEWKKIAQEVRDTQSLAPLVKHLEGLKYASADVEKTLESALSTLKTYLERIAVEGGAGIYQSLVANIQKVNDWLKTNRIVINFYISEAWKKLESALTSIWQWAKQVGTNLYTIFSTAGQAVWDTFGEALLALIKVIAQVILSVTNWVADNSELIGAIARMFVVSKLTGMFLGLSKAILAGVWALRTFIAGVPSAIAGIGSLATAARLAWAAFAGWAGVIAAVGFELARLAVKGAQKVTEMVKEQPSLGAMMLMGEAGGLYDWGKDPAGLKKQDEAAQQKVQEEKAKQAATEDPLATYTKKLGELSKGAPPPKVRPPVMNEEGGNGGKAGKERVEDLLRYLLEYLEAKRQLEIQEGEESFATFKAVQDKKKAELEQDLAAGKITGQEYYQALKDMTQAEADQALRLIDLKLAKEKEAYAWAQKELQERAAAGEISSESLDLAQKKLEAEHLLRLKQLEGQAIREKIELEKKVIDLLKQEYENHKKIEETLASGQEEMALGPIAEREAEICRLLRERVKLREELVRLGATEGELGQFDRVTRELEINKRLGDQIKGYTNLISGFFDDLADALMDGEKDLRQTLNKFFKSLFKQALEPAMKQMMQWLTDFFKQLFGSLGETILNSLMGVIAIIGMFLSSGGGESSWTASGVESSVTGHEAVRGIIAGETTIPVAQVSESLSEAVAPHLSVLRQIENNTRSSGGSAQVNVTIQGVSEAIREAMDAYFRDYLLMGARG